MNEILTQTRNHLAQFGRRVAVAGHWLVTGPESTIAADAIPYLDPIDEVCAEPGPRYTRSTLYACAGLCLSLLAIAALVKVDIVVVASGRLVTRTPPILLQPIDRSIIRELHVHAGDQVRKGQVLATLDPTFAQADLGSASAQQAALLAQTQRLEAELSDKPFQIGDKPSPELQLQKTLYDQRLANYRSRLKVFSEDIEQLNSSIKATEQDNALLGSQLAVARDVEEMRAALLKSQNGSRLNLLDSQATRMRSERDYQDSINRLAELKHQVQSKQAEQQAFIEDWRRQTLETLSSVQTQLAMVGENVSKASLVNDMVVVTSPVDGVVLNVAQRSVGSILQQAEPLITIIPSDAKLVADIGISSGDVGSTKAGDPVLLKIDAFPYGRHGGLNGHLLFIAEESTPASVPAGQINGGMGGGGAFHRGEVEISDMTLHNMPEGAHLIPGMTLTAEIKVGARSIIAYFLSPVTRGLGDALREP